MTISGKTRPMIMGALMGLMMMWMLHGALTGDSAMGASALFAFVGAHVVLVLIGVGVFWAGTRLSPRMQRFVARLHRPTFGHVAAMLGSAVVVAGVLHLSAHGLGGI